jgi:hypothetical protein
MSHNVDMRKTLVMALLACVCGAQANAQSWTDSYLPGSKLEALQIRPAPPLTRIGSDPGGKLTYYWYRYAEIRNRGDRVEITGSCVSACTLVLIIPKERICFGEHGQLRFHMPRDEGTPAPEWGAWMFVQYPNEVRNWIDARGGANKLPLNDYWTLSATELWKMGFAKCQ